MTVHYLDAASADREAAYPGLIEFHAREEIRALLNLYGQTGAEFRLSLWLAQEAQAKKEKAQ